jgi:putative peptidoglycan binding protein
MAVTETRRSVPLLAGISMLAIGLAASPVAIDLHPFGLGKNAAFAQAAGGGGGAKSGGGGSKTGATGGAATGAAGGAATGGAATGGAAGGAATGGDVGQERSSGGAPVGGGAPGGGRPGGGGDVGQTNQSGSQEVTPEQGAAAQSSMTQSAQGQRMDRDTIRAVQRKLNQMGYHAGPEDGVLGAKTHKAIAAYQTKMGMHADGRLTRDLADRITGS